MEYFIGLDWANEAHAVCVIDAKGAVKASFTAKHTREGLAKMVARLRKFGLPSQLKVSVERPSGLLVDTLVEAGFIVVPIHPNVVKASRSRYSSAHAKSDPGDAYLLADLLRTDGHRFKALEPLSDQVRALRAEVRTRDDMVAHRVALANQLRALLKSFWPGAEAVFGSIDSLIALAFIEKYPTPASAKQLGAGRMKSFLERHGYSGHRSPEQLIERLRAAPLGRTGELEAEAMGRAARCLVAAIRGVLDGISQLSKSIKRAVAELQFGRIMMSFPRAGKVNAAQIAAELGDSCERFGSEAVLAAHAGVAPVTYASGKKRGVGFRWAANKRLRVALTTFADNSRHASPWAKATYLSARRRGKDHSHAIRILARAWLRVIWGCWKDGVEYDPTKHRAARPFLALQDGGG